MSGKLYSGAFPVNIAVVGSGISGLSVAYLLSRAHRVELFEREPRLGGHAHTHSVERGGRRIALDSGFIVYNRRTYPNFVRLLDELGVRSRLSDMSFGIRCRRCRLEFSTRGFSGLFAQPRRLADPAHWRMLADVRRFYQRARVLLDGPGEADPSLGEFLEIGGYSSGFLRHFLLPMAGAIWSASGEDILSFPARSFLRFYDNHGLLSASGAPPWWTIEGGSRTYVDAIAARLSGPIHLDAPVRTVTRDPEGVEIQAAGGLRKRFDRVVLATHADEALTLLADASPAEADALGCFRYSSNPTVLHTDGSALPSIAAARASWNCDLTDCRDQRAPVSVTYDLARLHALDAGMTFCVSLNRPRPADEHVVAEMTYTHPVMDSRAFGAQARVLALNGVNRTYYCGAHLGYGFHEDGLVSALGVSNQFGIAL